MKLGIIISQTNAELVWNAFRLANFSVKTGDHVQVFLLAEGVTCEEIHSEKFDIKTQMQEFVQGGGEILACGTCLKIRSSEGSELCPLSTMKELHALVRDCDRVVTF